MVFRSPDWEDGYGGDLLTEPPPERTAWCDPDDRDGLAAVLLECACDTIARVGWRPEFEELDLHKGARPSIWRKKLNMTSHWTGHVWDARTVESDGSLRIHLRLTVRFVDWQLDGESATPRGHALSRRQPHIPPDIAEACYALTEGPDLARPVELEFGHYNPRCGYLLEIDETGRALKPDDRDGIEAALAGVAERIIEVGREKYGWPPEAVVDSHFGRWIAMRQRPGQDWFWDRNPGDDLLQALRAEYEAADVPDNLPSTWVGHVWEAWGAEPDDGERYGEQAGAVYLRLTIRDVVWQEGRVARLIYDLEPELRSRQKACVQNIPTASVASGPAPTMSPEAV